MYRLTIHRECSLMNRLGKCWVPEHGQGKVFSAGAKLHRDHDLLYQVGGGRTDNMATQYPVGLLMGQDLHQAIGIIGRQRTAACREGERP